MSTVTLSPKFQIVIPRSICRTLKLTPGRKFRIFLYGDRVEFMPVRKMQEMRGFLRGTDTTIDREDGDCM